MAASTSATPDSAAKLAKLISSQKMVSQLEDVRATPRSHVQRVSSWMKCDKAWGSRSSQNLLAQVKSGKLRLPDGGAKIASKLEDLEASLAHLQVSPETEITLTTTSSSQNPTTSRTNIPPTETRDLPPPQRAKVLPLQVPEKTMAEGKETLTGPVVERQIELSDTQGYLAPSDSGRSEDTVMDEATSAVSGVLSSDRVAVDGGGGRVAGGEFMSKDPGSSDMENRAVVRARVAERGQAATERAMARFVRVYEKVQIRAGSIEPAGGKLRPGAVQEVREKVLQELGTQINRETERFSSALTITEVDDESMEVESESSLNDRRPTRRLNLANAVQESYHNSSGTRSVNLISISEAGNLLRAHEQEVKRIEDEILERSCLGRRPPTRAATVVDSEDDYDDIDDGDEDSGDEDDA